MTQHVVGGQTFTLAYDAENRLVSVSGAAAASFLYDGDGKQVKAVVGSTTTYYIGAHYQVDNGVITKYYLAGATRIAMRKGTTLYYLLSDHASTMLSTSLGSTSLTLNSSGSKIAELRYRAWGETRYSSGTTYTPYQFTSQRNETALGLYFYNARWYDPSLGRFTRADTLVPAGAQGYDRYAYANNDPVRYTDPSGHMADRGDGGGCGKNRDCAEKVYQTLISCGTNACKQAAITTAIDFFDIDVSSTNTTPQYDPELGSEGKTDENKNITIGNSTFEKSFGYLAATIFHETIHTQQIRDGRNYGQKDENDVLGAAGDWLNEAEAYKKELDLASYFGLSAEERGSIEGNLNAMVALLPPVVLERYQNGNYSMEGLDVCAVSIYACP